MGVCEPLALGEGEKEEVKVSARTVILPEPEEEGQGLGDLDLLPLEVIDGEEEGEPLVRVVTDTVGEASSEAEVDGEEDGRVLLEPTPEGLRVVVTAAEVEGDREEDSLPLVLGVKEEVGEGRGVEVPT